MHSDINKTEKLLSFLQYYGEVLFCPWKAKNDRMVGAACTGCCWGVHFPQWEYWWCFSPETGGALVYESAFICVCVYVCGCTVCRRMAGQLISVISLPCSYPVFIFQIVFVLHQPWSATTQEVMSLACWACYKNTANNEPCTKSYQSLANLFTNAQLPMESGWLGKMCFSAKDTNKTWSFDLQPEWIYSLSTGYFLAKVTNLQWQKLWLYL